MRASVNVIKETQTDFAQRFGRDYGFTEEYWCDDADVIVVSLGTLGKEAEVAIDILRKEGIKAGSMRIRWFRPFPELDLSGKEVVVIDRNYSFGFGGVIAHSVRSKNFVKVYSVIAGLGGQEVTYDDIAGFVRNRRIGEEFWFGVNDRV